MWRVAFFQESPVVTKSDRKLTPSPSRVALPPAAEAVVSEPAPSQPGAPFLPDVCFGHHLTPLTSQSLSPLNSRTMWFGAWIFTVIVSVCVTIDIACVLCLCVRVYVCTCVHLKYDCLLRTVDSYVVVTHKEWDPAWSADIVRYQPGSISLYNMLEAANLTLHAALKAPRIPLPTVRISETLRLMELVCERVKWSGVEWVFVGKAIPGTRCVAHSINLCRSTCFLQHHRGCVLISVYCFVRCFPRNV
jgi:hypothetical protein